MVKGWEAVSSLIGAGAVKARLSIGKMKMAVIEMRQKEMGGTEGGVEYSVLHSRYVQCYIVVLYPSIDMEQEMDSYGVQG